MDTDALKDRLIYQCQHDGLEPPSVAPTDEALRMVNIGYRLLSRAADAFDVETTGLTVPASSGYPLKRVPVTLPVHSDSTGPKYYAIRTVFYPDTSYTFELDNDCWRLAQGTLYLLDKVTDGVKTLGVWGYQTPASLVNGSDVPNLPEEFQEAIVWAAMTAWLPGYATNTDLQNRRAVYRSLYKEFALELQRASDQTFAVRKATAWQGRIISRT